MKKGVLKSGLPARKIPSVFLLFKNVRKSVEPSNLAGNFVSLERKTKLLQMLQNALLQKTALNPLKK